MDAIRDIARRIAAQHEIPVQFFFDLFALERDRITQMRRRNIATDIRKLLRRDYWEDRTQK